MIRSPLGIRIGSRPGAELRDQIRDAARWGAKTVVLEAIGDLSPDRLGETGRRDLRHVVKSCGLELFAVVLPTRRPFDVVDQLDQRLARAERAFVLGHELGAATALVQPGRLPGAEDTERGATLRLALDGLTHRAEHHGVVLALETALDSGAEIGAIVDAVKLPNLAASVDAGGLLRAGHDPVAAVVALGRRVRHVYAAEAGAAAGKLVLPRGGGFSGQGLDWESFLGALEEVNYRGPLTIWPDAAADARASFLAAKAMLDAF